MERDLKKCLEYLGVKGKGRRVKGLTDDGDVIMDIRRRSGAPGWAVGRWNDDEGRYSVCMDPDISAGPVQEIVYYYKPSKLPLS